MSINYNAIVGFKAKTTLPSVDSWGTNMNMLRDPPKSIHTRKIDKVLDTSQITQMIQDSGNRAAEAILVYARGSNPMVGVDYSNNGNNGGQRSGGSRTAGFTVNGGNSGKQSFLPYRVMRDGAFRPPIRDQRELLPLSRLPRVWTSSFTQASFPDFSKKAMCPGTDMDTKGVKTPDQMLKACARPTATYQIEMPLTEPFEVKHVIKNPLTISGFSGNNYKTRINAEMGDPDKGVVQNPLRVQKHINLSDNPKNTEFNVHTEKYIQDSLQGEMNSNVSRNIHITPIDEIYNEHGIKDQFNISYTAPQTSYEKQEYIHQDIELNRVLPQHQAKTNIGRSIHKPMDHTPERIYTLNRPSAQAYTNVGVNNVQTIDNITNRHYNLKPTINAGSFDSAPNLQQVYHENQNIVANPYKSQMRSRVYDMQQERNQALGNLPFIPQETSV
jgi:hypothetical protein